MSTIALAALLKPLIWPVMAFVGLLLARWVAIIIWRLMPDGALRQTLFDKGLLDRTVWLKPSVTVVVIVALFAYASTFD